MALEYMEYNPPEKKPVTEPENKTSDQDIINDALSLMQSVQVTETQEPETTEESFNAMAKTPEEIIEENKEPETKPEETQEPEPETKPDPEPDPEPETQEPIKENIIKPNDFLGFNISAPFLKHIIKLQSTASNEGKIIFDKDKIVLSNVDPAHVMMIMQEIPIQVLNEYKINDTLE